MRWRTEGEPCSHDVIHSRSGARAPSRGAAVSSGLLSRIGGGGDGADAHLLDLLLFAGDFVYKVKKPVDLGFLDFSTLERRRHFCGEEVRLNRRLSPDTYLGVVTVVNEAMGGRVSPKEITRCRFP